MEKEPKKIVTAEAETVMQLCKYQCDNVMTMIKLVSGACFVNGKEKAELDEKLKEQMEFWGSLYNKIYYAEKGEEES